MVRSDAIEIIARNLRMNNGRAAALAQRAAEGGLLPKARGRDVPVLGPLQLAKLFLSIVADCGLGRAADTVGEFCALRTESGATFIDLVEGWISGAVNVGCVHSVILQIKPTPAVTIVTDEAFITYGATSGDGAHRIVVVSGDALRNIVSEFRDKNEKAI